MKCNFLQNWFYYLVIQPEQESPAAPWWVEPTPDPAQLQLAATVSAGTTEEAGAETTEEFPAVNKKEILLCIELKHFSTELNF